MPVATDSSTTYSPIKAPRGNQLSCKGWAQEAAMRMLMNNLDEEVAERPQDLVVYGGTGRAARNWDCYHAIVRSLQALDNDETLLVQSGKPVAVFRTHDYAPRVYDTARKMLRSHLDSEDVTQDVLLKVVRKLPSFRGESALIGAFRELGANSMGAMGNVMGGIAEALIATAVGILVALPAVIYYNVFQKKGSDVEEQAAALGNIVIATMRGHGHSAPVAADPVLNGQVSAINVHFDAVADERYYAMSRHNRNKIAVLRMLMYGLRSCHWSLPSIGC